MADALPPLTGEPNVVNGLLQGWGEWQRQHFESANLVAKHAFELNKQIASFHERLVLISLGTIGLSVTALTAFIPKIPTIRLPKHVFFTSIAPAWTLLMMSSIGSLIVMSHTLVANRVLILELRKLANQATFRRAASQMREFSKALSGTLTRDSQTYDVKEVFTRHAEELDKQLEAISGDQTQKDLVEPAKIATIGRFAMIFLHLGLIFLAISAMRLFAAF